MRMVGSCFVRSMSRAERPLCPTLHCQIILQKKQCAPVRRRMKTDMQTINGAEPIGMPEPGRAGEFFRQLSPEALKSFARLEHPAHYPANAVLFMEKDTPRGVFVLCEGRVKLSISSSDGRKLILRVAEAGDLLDMPAALSGAPYGMTAETLHCCKNCLHSPGGFPALPHGASRSLPERGS